jgi:hypothetical protein
MWRDIVRCHAMVVCFEHLYDVTCPGVSLCGYVRAKVVHHFLQCEWCGLAHCYNYYDLGNDTWSLDYKQTI